MPIISAAVITGDAALSRAIQLTKNTPPIAGEQAEIEPDPRQPDQAVDPAVRAIRRRLGFASASPTEKVMEPATGCPSAEITR